MQPTDRLKEYAERVVAYARGELDDLDIIPSVRPWGPEEIRERAGDAGQELSGADRIRLFAQFVEAECHVLLKLASHPRFFAQHAYNYANSAPVAEAAESVIQAEAQPLFLLRSSQQRPAHNPSPALVRTIEESEQWKDPHGIATASTACGDIALASFGASVLHVWNLRTGECLATLEGHEGKVRCVSVTPDGRRAVSGGADGALCLWDLESSRCVNRFQVADTVHSVFITPDGERAFSGSFGSLTSWDLALAEPLFAIERPGLFLADLSITPDFRLAATLCRPRWSSESRLELWDLTSARCLRQLGEQADPVNSVRLSADGRRAVTGCQDKSVRVWNLETGECVDTLEGHTRDVQCVAITADGKRAVSGSQDKTLKIWDLEESRCIKTFEGHTQMVRSLDLTPDGARAVSGGDDGTLRVWDVEKGICLRESEKHGHYVENIEFTPDGTNLISGGADLILRTWNLETGEYVTSLMPDEVRHPRYPGKRALEAHSRMVFVPGGQRVVTETVTLIPDEWKVDSAGKRESSLRVRDTNVFEQRLSIEEVPCDLDFTPSGRRAVVGSFDNELRVWDLETGDCLRNLAIRIRGITDHIHCVSVSPDGKIAAALSSDGTVRLWSLEQAECLRTLEGEGAALITGDGRKIVVGGGDHSVFVFDAASEECLNRFEGCTGRTGSLTVTPDCRHLISGSQDRTVRVWDLERGECVGIYHAGAGITAFSHVSSVGAFGCGTDDGEVITLAMKNLSMGPMVVTPVRMWLYGDGATSGRWDDHLTAACQWCGRRFPVSRKILDVIEAIGGSAGASPGGSPCLSLPEGAWNEQLLLSECPRCNGALRFNPFVADDSE